MRKIWWWVQVPLMLLWNALRERELADVLRPYDEPRAHRGAGDCDRILIFGRGLALGWGVLSHEISLTGSLAQALSERTGRGAEVTTVADAKITVRSAIEWLTALRLERYDAIVITFGDKGATTTAPTRRWAGYMRALLRFVEDHNRRTAQVFVLGIQPVRALPVFDALLGDMTELHDRAINAVTVRICKELPRTTFVPLTAAPHSKPGRFPAAADYRRWGEQLADQMADPVTAGRVSRGTPGTYATGDGGVVESDRRIAIEDLHILDTAPEVRFDRIVKLAQSLFATRGAAFSLVDGDRHWYKTLIGGSWTEVPREGSITSVAMESRGALVVGDARIDPRFRHSPLVVGGPLVRFYAGYPIESASGDHIGVLVVFDPKPRDTRDFDESLLRTCALMIQTELEHGTPTHREPTPA